MRILVFQLTHSSGSKILGFSLWLIRWFFSYCQVLSSTRNTFRKSMRQSFSVFVKSVFFAFLSPPPLISATFLKSGSVWNQRLFVTHNHNRTRKRESHFMILSLLSLAEGHVTFNLTMNPNCSSSSRPHFISFSPKFLSLFTSIFSDVSGHRIKIPLRNLWFVFWGNLFRGEEWKKQMEEKNKKKRQFCAFSLGKKLCFC